MQLNEINAESDRQTREATRTNEALTGGAAAGATPGLSTVEATTDEAFPPPAPLLSLIHI